MCSCSLDNSHGPVVSVTKNGSVEQKFLTTVVKWLWLPERNTRVLSAGIGTHLVVRYTCISYLVELPNQMAHEISTRKHEILNAGTAVGCVLIDGVTRPT